MASKYFELANGGVLFKKTKVSFDSIPHDDMGLCIFHSKNGDWKRKNKFHTWLNALLEIVVLVDRNKIDVKEPGEFKNISLIGFHFIGKPRKLLSGETDYTLIIKSLKLHDYTTLYFDEASFADKIHFQNCKLPKGTFIFREATFERELQMSNCHLSQLSFNDAVLASGLLINNSVFDDHTEFCNLQIETILQVTNTSFAKNAFFNHTVYDCEVLLDNNQFSGVADFNDCSFRNDVSIENCTFEKEAEFNNTRFENAVDFTGNTYRDNVYFISTQTYNKIFYGKVHFLFIDAEEELTGKLIFENVSFVNIVEEHRNELLRLSTQNKVSIGSGCIKYRVQTPPIEIETSDINRNLISELSNSFTNYFISSNGIKLGVEFLDKSLHNLKLFYFTDEDITLEELNTRLRHTEKSYWNFSLQKRNVMSETEMVRHIENYVSRLGILSKIKLQSELGLWSENDTKKMLEIISFPRSSVDASQITLSIQNLNIRNMRIENVNAHAGSQVNIADKIERIEFAPAAEHLSQETMEHLKRVFLSFDESTMNEIDSEVRSITDCGTSFSNSNNLGKMEKLKLKFDELCTKNGLPIVQSLTASALYDVLKWFFLGN